MAPAPPLQDPDEMAAASGLDEVALASLPPDAPRGHASYRKACYRSQHNIIVFTYNGVNFQTTLVACKGSRYAAARICRACYLKFEENVPKEQVLEFRAECYARFQAAAETPVMEEAVVAEEPAAAEAKLKAPAPKSILAALATGGLHSNQETLRVRPASNAATEKPADPLDTREAEPSSIASSASSQQPSGEPATPPPRLRSQPEAKDVMPPPSGVLEESSSAPADSVSEQGEQPQSLLQLSHVHHNVRSRLPWARDELMTVLGAEECNTFTRAAVESRMQLVMPRLKALGLDDACNAAADQIPATGEVTILDLVDCILHHCTRAYPPVSAFRDATPEELKAFPALLADFETHLSAKSMKPSSCKSFRIAIGQLAAIDKKAPEEMATKAYHAFVKHTCEDVSNNGLHSVGLKKFASFWHEAERRSLAELALVEGSGALPAVKRRRQAVDGDGSEEARMAESLPEGWRVHTNELGSRALGWSSPRGQFYSKSELQHRLNPSLPPAFVLPRSASLQKEITPEKCKLGRPFAIPSAKEKEPALPLEELLGPVPASESAEARDRRLLPRVISTYTRFLAEERCEKIRQQSTRNNYTLAVFKLFAKTGRSFDAMAGKRFLELVTASAENRKSHNALGSAIRSFSSFWQQWGGYDAVFDKADRDTLQVTLQIKPQISDTSGLCGAGGISAEPCRYPKRRCETCGTILRCSKHDEHTLQACRDVFWDTHLPDGTRVRTLSQFFGQTKGAGSQGEGAPSVVCSKPKAELGCIDVDFDIFAEVRRSFRLPSENAQGCGDGSGSATSPTAAWAALRHEAKALSGALRRVRENEDETSSKRRRQDAEAALQHVLDVVQSTPEIDLPSACG